MSDVKVLPVPRGSLIVVTGMEFESSMFDQLREALLAKIGHDEFVIVQTDNPDGTVEVIGSVDELVERVRAALDQAGIATKDG